MCIYIDANALNRTVAMLSPQDTVAYATILLRMALDWPYRVKAKRSHARANARARA
jgi:hypothetical protein